MCRWLRRNCSLVEVVAIRKKGAAEWPKNDVTISLVKVCGWRVVAKAELICAGNMAPKKSPDMYRVGERVECRPECANCLGELCRFPWFPDQAAVLKATTFKQSARSFNTSKPLE